MVVAVRASGTTNGKQPLPRGGGSLIKAQRQVSNRLPFVMYGTQFFQN